MKRVKKVVADSNELAEQPSADLKTKKRKSVKETLAKIKSKIKLPKINLKRKKKTFTYMVNTIDSPMDYEYIEATSEADAIEKSAYMDKSIVRAKLKPEYNCYVLDMINGAGREYIEPKELKIKCPDAKEFEFSSFNSRLYYVYREYNEDMTEYKLVPFTRPVDSKFMPDMLYHATCWEKDLHTIMTCKDTKTIDTIQSGALLALVGILFILIVILMDA